MSDILFARPSFLEGIARNLDLFGILNNYNYSRDTAEADLKAMRSDLEALKHDFDVGLQGMYSGNQIQEK